MLRARTAMTTAMGRIEASAQVEPLPVFAFFFRRRARAGRPTPLPRPGPLGNRAGALHAGRRAMGMAELAHVCHHRFATTLHMLALAHGTLKRAPPRGPRLTVRGVGVPPWRPPRGNNDARVGRVGGWPFPEGKCVLGYTPGKGMQPSATQQHIVGRATSAGT